jgi:hypothetical protein
VTAQDFKDESTWLRHSLLRLLIILRYATDSRAETGLRRQFLLGLRDLDYVEGRTESVKPLCRRLLRPSAVRIGRPATIIRTSLIYPVRGATNRAKCILLGFPETKSSLPASFLNGRNHPVDLNADRKASASLPASTLSIPICLETVTLALPFLGEIHLIARILLDGFIRALCQRRR